MRQIAKRARYTENMEWACPASENNDELLIIGLSDFAQKAAGVINFIELPKIIDHFEKGSVFAIAESDKMANEIFMSVSGTIHVKTIHELSLHELSLHMPFQPIMHFP